MNTQLLCLYLFTATRHRDLGNCYFNNGSISHWLNFAINLWFACMPNSEGGIHTDHGSTTAHYTTNQHAICGFEFRIEHNLLMKLIGKLSTLGLSTTLCKWMLDFLTNRPQTVQIGGHTSSTLVLSTGAPQRCVLGPLLFTLCSSQSEQPADCSFTA